MPNSSKFIQAIINAALPKGAIWEYSEDGDLDHLYQGIADNEGLIYEFLESLAYIRNALKTPFLEDLERDYGIVPDAALDEAERRQQLKAMFPRRSSGTAEYLQEKLRELGITNVYVHRNDPPISPLGFGWTIFGRVDAIFGRDNAQFGDAGVFGKLIVNGKSSDEDFTPIADSCIGFWSAVFFIGGVATRDPSTHKIISIEYIEIPVKFKDIMIRTIMEVKPFHTWAYKFFDFI